MKIGGIDFSKFRNPDDGANSRPAIFAGVVTLACLVIAVFCAYKFFSLLF